MLVHFARPQRGAVPGVIPLLDVTYAGLIQRVFAQDAPRFKFQRWIDFLQPFGSTPGKFR